MAVEVKYVTKHFGPDTVLDKVSIVAPTSQVTGLQGINGSGKTMLMRAICGLIHIDEGEIWIDDTLLGTDMEFPPHVGVLLEQASFLGDKTAFWNLYQLARIKGLIGEDEVRDALKKVGLDPDLRKPFKKYSQGMRQRVGIAAAIMERPNLLILDEPTNALDEAGIALLEDILHEACAWGATVIVSCHDTEILQAFTHQIYHLRNGQVIDWTQHA
ncbi:ATP-binding cassette domain-containing protein [Collinsella sp. zg1085]|uniref:ATP-binding cassette domain-containing protein n=1 Tax=Collinsella sp. zg1085 TaxID=2844380 RepID=UPI001C0D66EF|nr:ATP-binding cassette domain-containing protein [Collinsella sp. zg1085]QWT17102.1 ATP-binding cassette domain-containing protein [Collinsella sp. zg1085]